MDEQARERGEIESSIGTERLREGRERSGETAHGLGGSVRERSLGLDVQEADDGLSAAQRDCELRDDARQGTD